MRGCRACGLESSGRGRRGRSRKAPSEGRFHFRFPATASGPLRSQGSWAPLTSETRFHRTALLVGSLSSSVKIWSPTSSCAASLPEPVSRDPGLELDTGRRENLSVQDIREGCSQGPCGEQRLLLVSAAAFPAASRLLSPCVLENPGPAQQWAPEGSLPGANSEQGCVCSSARTSSSKRRSYSCVRN